MQPAYLAQLGSGDGGRRSVGSPGVVHSPVGRDRLHRHHVHVDGKRRLYLQRQRAQSALKENRSSERASSNGESEERDLRENSLRTRRARAARADLPRPKSTPPARPASRAPSPPTALPRERKGRPGPPRRPRRRRTNRPRRTSEMERCVLKRRLFSRVGFVGNIYASGDVRSCVQVGERRNPRRTSGESERDARDVRSAAAQTDRHGVRVVQEESGSRRARHGNEAQVQSAPVGRPRRYRHELKKMRM